MSLEKPLGLTDHTEKKEPQETKKSLDAFRSKLLGALALGTSAFLAACGELKRGDIEKMPPTAIEDILKNPDDYTKMPIMRIQGYPVMTSEKAKVLIIPVKAGRGMAMIPIRVTTGCYDIYADPGMKGGKLEGCTTKGRTYFPNIRQGEKVSRLHEIVGRVEKEGEDKSKYIFEVHGTIDTEAPVSKVRK